MKEAIKKQNLNNEFYTPEKCYITELSNIPEDSRVIAAIWYKLYLTERGE